MSKGYVSVNIPCGMDEGYYVSVLLSKADIKNNDPHAVDELIQVKMKNAELHLRDILKRDGHEIHELPKLRYE